MSNQKTRSRIVSVVFLSAWGLMIFSMHACSRTPSVPMSIKMSISPEPIVGREVTLHIELLSAQESAPNTVLTVTLPLGIELMKGDLNWQGDLTADQPVGIDLAIRVTAEGEWPIAAHAFSSDTPGSRFGVGAGKGLYVRSSVSSAEVIEDVDRETTPIPVYQGGPETLPSPTSTTP